MDITSANSSIVISSADIALAATQLEGFGADASFATEDVESAVTQIGVDGKMSAGWVPRITNMTITLNPASASVAVFDTIITTADTLRAPVWLNCVVQIPSIGKSYTLSKGVLSRVKQAPDGGRVLAEQKFTLSFESCRPAII